jgi:hypothetical protein
MRYLNVAAKLLIVTLSLSPLGISQQMTGGTFSGATIGIANSDPFTAFCSNEPTVKKCVPLDTAPPQVSITDLLDGVFPVATGEYDCGLDTSVKANGAGSLRCDVPASASADQVGGYKFNFTPACGEGDDCWLQYRYRVDTAWKNLNPKNAGGVKMNQIELKDVTVGGTDYVTNNCTTPELINNEYFYLGFPFVYEGCGANDDDYKPMQPTFNSGSDYLLQPGWLACFYSDASACNFWTPDDWMTVTVHFKQGQKYVTMSTNYGHNSVFETYMGTAGNPTQRTISMTDFDSVLGANGGDFVNGVVPPGYDPQRGKVWLDPYNTGRCRSTYTVVSASRTSGITTLTLAPPYNAHSQGGACVTAGDSIVVTGLTDASFNGTWTATASPQPDDNTVIVNNAGTDASITSQSGTAIDSNIEQVAAKVWYDSVVVTVCDATHNCRPPDLDALTPNAPSDLQVTSNDGTDVILSWKDNTTVYGSPAWTSWRVNRCTGEIYRVCYAISPTWTDITSSVSASIDCATTPGTCTATDAGAGGTQYTYEVAAVNGSGTSGYSNGAMNTPGAVYDVTCSANSSTSVTCSWTQAPPAIATTGYDVAWCADVAATCGNAAATTGYTTATTSATCCSATVSSGLSASTTYTFRVKPHNAAGTYIDWGERFYGGTSYGWGGQGATPTSQVTTPSTILADNTAASLGAGSALYQTPQLTVPYSFFCPQDATLPENTFCPFNAVLNWNGAVWDDQGSRLVMKAGGGHADYYGNEGYQLTVSVSGGALVGTVGILQTAAGDDIPTTPVCHTALTVALPYQGSTTQCTAGTVLPCIDDGTHLNCARGSYHKYGGEAINPSTRDLYEFGGFVAYDIGTAVADAWLYYLDPAATDTGKWLWLSSYWTQSGGTVQRNADNACDYDRSRNTFWCSNENGSSTFDIYEHDVYNALGGGANKIYKRSSFSVPSGFAGGLMAKIDQTNHKMLIAIPASTRYFWEVDLTGAFGNSDITSSFTGCSLYTTADSATFNFAWMGMSWDSDNNKIHVYPNGGSTVWEVDANGGCTGYAIGGYPIPTYSVMDKGTFGRFSYDPTHHVDIHVPTDITVPAVAFCVNKPGGC